MAALHFGAVGARGRATASVFVTVTGHQWTTGTAVVHSVTTEGGAFLNTVSLAGYDHRTANHAGKLQLVTPIRIVTNAAGTLPGFGIQTLTFVPEPGTLLLIGSGIAVLGVVGRRKQRG